MPVTFGDGQKSNQNECILMCPSDVVVDVPD